MTFNGGEVGHRLAVLHIRRHDQQGIIGGFLWASLLQECGTYVNKYPQAKQVWTVTIGTATNGATYTIDVGGTPFSYVATSGTDTVIASGFAEAFNQQTDVSSQFFAVASSATIVLTARTYGVSVTVSDSDAKLSCSLTTAAGSANAVTFGDVCVKLSGRTRDGKPFATCASSSLFTAQVSTLACVYAAGETYQIALTVYGKTYFAGPVVADTNTNTTATAIRAAATAAFASLPVTISGATDKCIVTANLAGIGFSVAVSTGSGTVSRFTITDTTAGSLVDFNAAAAGLAVAVANQPSNTVGQSSVQYVANATMTVAPLTGKVPIQVYNTETLTGSEDVWVELAPGASAGLCYSSSTSTRVKWVGATWIPKSTDNAAGVYLNSVLAPAI